MEFQKKMYERYKLKWMMDCGYTTEDLVKSLVDYMQDADDFLCPTNCSDVMEEWEFESGFNGSLWVCFEEFLGNEFRDEDFMKSICSEKEMELVKAINDSADYINQNEDSDKYYVIGFYFSNAINPTYVVRASSDEQALDVLADYFEENDDRRFITEDVDDATECICAGNHCLYLDTPILFKCIKTN